MQLSFSTALVLAPFLVQAWKDKSCSAVTTTETCYTTETCPPDTVTVTSTCLETVTESDKTKTVTAWPVTETCTETCTVTASNCIVPMSTCTTLMTTAIVVPPNSSVPPPPATSTSGNSSPTNAAKTPFTVYASRSGSPIHLEQMNANGNLFWFGKPTDSFCPSTIPDCPAGNVTAMELDTGDVFMDAEVPGGQQVYVSPSGALSFTIAHSGEYPGGSFLTEFNYDPPNAIYEPGVFSFHGGGATTFIACPSKGNVAPYQVFANIDGLSNSDVPGGDVSQCLSFDALTQPFVNSPAAFQYD